MPNTSTTIRIGGVPEHFNLPWQLAAERDVFSAHKVNLAWTVYAGGTGAMTKALSNGELDMAILLTEGFVSAVHQGLKAKLAKIYIETPLIWGIYTGANSRIQSIEDTSKGRYAISRFGSGSHLMAMIHAKQFGRAIADDQFVVVNSLHGAMESLAKNDSEFFYWEKYMTRPFVKQGIARLIGEFSAPWSGFMIAVSEDALQSKADAIQEVLRLMNAECIGFKQDNSSVIHLGKRFDMSLQEARRWLRDTHWNYNYQGDEQGLINARNALSVVGMADAQMNVRNLAAPWIRFD